MEAKPQQKQEEKEQQPQKAHFQAKYIPKGFFQLFKKNDTYIYEKKFSCDLPKNIIPPKSFHYPFSLENYCQSDLLTMDFDLKKNPEILTDPKINTLVHQDFINNTLELIFPNLTTISKKRTEEEQKFKKKIIEIIERNDDANQEINPIFDELPDFLRRQTYLRPSTAVNTDHKSKLKDKLKSDKKPQKSYSELKSIIEQSFNDIDKIKEGMKHPDPKQKGVTAKKIYEVSPMDDMPNVQFVEYLFPSEPSQIINLDKKYLKPEKFLIKMNRPNDISDENTCSFYINNKLKTQEDHKEKDTSEYYSYETDFTCTKIPEGDLFNRYFFILDKVNKKLKISKLSDKYDLRRYKRIMEEEIIEKDENGNYKTLGKKRRRNIITVPQSMEKEEFDKKKKWISERGYTTRLIERKIETVNHSDVVEIEKEKELEEENKKNQNQNEYEQEENNMEEEENEDNEHKYFQSNQNKQDSEHNEEENYIREDNDNEEENEQQNEDDNNGDEEENENDKNNEENENNEEMENNEEKEEKEERDEKDENNEQNEEEDDEEGEDVFK
jgi:hypothetical protein